ncbi:hypothetical protein D2V93_02245 [Flagellimonas taeanensis]|uniref:hypothetical protein n=1 Tax=Flavobacteriaceae TaxID=49546 RepID=UPI000E6928C6|nr:MULTISPECIES: hypothetical protein [Allomuricauda]MDC6384618.1 hypothetical protein [Muricauda sp. SK9]MDC6384627.1 hypothetical protein [Muricauda sp. SK9]RIV51644.1 hypothetical protein D2V93_06990 [Allomuricauda taeanensis]RIV53626.1 hypothetical protein D2V93_02245 [Allomuricauda taeanensis]
MSSDLKNKKLITYRGILSFEIPKNWIEEYDDNDGGTFYKNSPKSGTLRVKIISIKVPESSNIVNTADVLNDLTLNKGSKTMVLPNKNAYKMFYEEATDDGLDITIYYWSLVQSIQFNKTRLVNFSYTVLSEELDSECVRQEIDFITYQVENAIFEPL